MKIFTDNAVYVQKNDIAFLNQTDLLIPGTIYMKVFGKGVTIIDNHNRHEFVKFDNPNEIEFFREQDWIVDYDSFKDLTEEEIIELGQKVVEQKNSIAKRFNSMTNKERYENQQLIDECERLDYKMYSLRDAILFKRGELTFKLPKGVKKPTIIVPENSSPQQENGVKKFLKKIRKTTSKK